MIWTRSSEALVKPRFLFLAVPSLNGPSPPGFHKGWGIGCHNSWLLPKKPKVTFRSWRLRDRHSPKPPHISPKTLNYWVAFVSDPFIYQLFPNAAIRSGCHMHNLTGLELKRGMLHFNHSPNSLSQEAKTRVSHRLLHHHHPVEIFLFMCLTSVPPFSKAH